jgi:hypothetical protein
MPSHGGGSQVRGAGKQGQMTQSLCPRCLYYLRWRRKMRKQLGLAPDPPGLDPWDLPKTREKPSKQAANTSQ